METTTNILFAFSFYPVEKDKILNSVSMTFLKRGKKSRDRLWWSKERKSSNLPWLVQPLCWKHPHSSIKEFSDCYLTQSIVSKIQFLKNKNAKDFELWRVITVDTNHHKTLLMYFFTVNISWFLEDFENVGLWLKKIILNLNLGFQKELQQ